MMTKKEYPKNGLEMDAVYGRAIYKYIRNTHGLTRWVKRQMNKRFRRRWKQKARGIHINIK